MKNKSKLIMTVVVAVLIGFPTITYAREPNVYVTGNEGWYFANLWRNSTAERLLHDGMYAGANSIFVSGRDVFAAGFIAVDTELDLGDMRVPIPRFATLWRNGVAQRLSDGNFPSAANSVFVSGRDVFVAGYVRTERSINAMLWRNGIAQRLCAGVARASANSVFVSGRNVFVAGYEIVVGDSGAQFFATLWRNGTAQRLNDGRTHARANSVYVSGRDVFVVGWEANAQSQVATLWRNGTAQRLSDGRTRATANSVFVSGRDVFVAGYEVNAQGVEVATLWRNGAAQRLSDGRTRASATSVYVSGRDVFVVGYVFTGGGRMERDAILWRNGVAQRLSNNSHMRTEANSVFVTR